MRALACMLLTMFIGAAATAQVLPHHELSVTLDPTTHALRASDHITLPSGASREQVFLLNKELRPSSPDAELTAVPGSDDRSLQEYRVTLPNGRESFTVDYAGEIFRPPQQDVREARTFESTPGIIAPEGTVLSGASGWYPNLENDMLTFRLDVSMPTGWRAVSQGRRMSDQASRSVWQENNPQQEIYLVAAPFHERDRTDAGIEEMVLLRKDDAALAERYLDATGRYLGFYQKLIGPYPYAKFALVENFWETGYGMPSFTLLGSQVIRLPFIIDTSYPHEILHNWWGNGVYVDYSAGNWSEGLTAYLADHLLQEQKGNGAEYRRSTLQKYTDFVSAGRDFPLAEFQSRHSEQTEALGYGKGMMLFHMLRRKVGDDAFVRALQSFYRKHLFQRASFTDLEQSLAEASGLDLRPMFEQWVQRTGAPQLSLATARARRAATGYELDAVIEQVQPGPAYALDVPVAVTLAGQDVAQPAVVEMTGKRAEVTLQLPARPLRVDVDPEFDVFRRLSQDEIPPAFSEAFGAEKLLIVLPGNAPQELRESYRSIAEAWQRQPGRETQIRWDQEVERLPQTGAVWLFGWENRFIGQLGAAMDNATLSRTDAQFGGGKFERAVNALALAARIGQTPTAWLAAPDAQMLPVLARKLPHYARFSYAAFSGPELTNLAKGMWPVTGSPLGKAVMQEDGSAIEAHIAKLPVRRSLAGQ